MEQFTLWLTNKNDVQCLLLLCQEHLLNVKPPAGRVNHVKKGDSTQQKGAQ